MRQGSKGNRRTDRRRGRIPTGTYRECRRPHVARGRTSAAASIPCAHTPGPRVSACLRQAPPGVTKHRCARGDEALLRHALSPPLSLSPTNARRGAWGGGRGGGGPAEGTMRRPSAAIRAFCKRPPSTAFVPPAASCHEDPARSATRAPHGSEAWWGPSSGTPTAEPAVPRSAALRLHAPNRRAAVLAVPWSTAAVAGLASGRSLAGLLRS
jgi:hypothetical protein